MNEEINKGNASAFGEFSVLTPSQKRALEKAEEEKRQDEAAKQERRRLIAEKRRERDAKARKLQLAESLVIPFIIIFIGTGFGSIGFSCESPGLGVLGLIFDIVAGIWVVIIISKYKQ